MKSSSPSLALLMCVLFAIINSSSSVAAAPSPVAAVQSCSPAWVPTFGDQPGTDGRVYCTETYTDMTGTALYVGGTFNTAGGVPSTKIARWDGTRWSSLGAGINTGSLTAINSMVVYDDGGGPALYVAGNFVSAGGLPANNIARWRNGAWSTTGLGSGTNGEVNALAVYDDGSGPSLFVGGYFSTAGGVSASRLAKWRNGTWSAVGTVTSGYVFALKRFNDGTCDALYVGGSFSGIGTVPNANGIARYCGNGAWSTLGSGVSGGDVRALEVHNDGFAPALYVGGGFNSAGGIPGTNHIARWSGGANPAWSDLGGGIAGTWVGSLKSFDDGSGPALYVGGSVQFSRWKSTQWSVVGGGTNSFVESIGVYDSGFGPEIVAGGWFSTAGAVLVNSIARWNGSAWRACGAGFNGSVQALSYCDPGIGSALYIGGDFVTGGSVALNRIGRFVGGAVQPLGTGLNGTPRAIEAYDLGTGPALYVAGDFTTAGGINSTNRIAKWDGTAWSKLGSGLNGSVYTLQGFEVNGSRAVYAGGSFTASSSLSLQRIAKWNGTAWSPLGTGLNGTCSKMVVFDEGAGPRLFVAGSFTAAGGVNGTAFIARWDGTTWTSVGGGLDGPALDLEVYDDGSGPALVVTGSFQHASGVATNRIARWNGVAWSPLGNGLDNTGNALAVYDDGTGRALYVGGAFTNAGTGSALRIARWRPGAGWSAVSQGRNSTVSALEAVPASCGSAAALYVGGAFTDQSPFDSYVSRWSCPYTPFGLSFCTSGTSSSGCVASICGIGVASASLNSDFTLSVVGVDGQRQGLFFYGLSNSGFVPLQWGNTGSYFCVKAPLQRSQTINSGGTAGQCDGTISLDWNSFVSANPSALGLPFSSGQVIYAQAWYRDPPNPKGTIFSDALEFQMQP